MVNNDRRYVPPRRRRDRKEQWAVLALVGLLAVVIVVPQILSRTVALTVPTATTKTVQAGSSAKPSTSAPTSVATSTAPAAPSAKDPVSGLRWVTLAELPAQASDTMKSIKAGPPYKYPKNDGVVYHNSEGILPKQKDGYYHEFTVVTPGASTRGARRIIAGGPKMGVTNAEWYYTDDHYSSFERIRP
ncbi:ribonuclease domain-containing protein [Propioniciclava tarda]|uniref:Ribonuclease n=1 Tax=Propioniciclava tarda TaxID=433330 RepID=A0A4Q9KK52_PROTD|nr:ribonuclease domain-containing protein [Propioniciclava tarda]TBT94545.1 ribonuclease [Propioniciclava tarda]SMO68614.1 ribonuclease T1 [Propioniciclava tarda]HQA29998.1 ribonuclease domain-containing protein [Propioniciclava tarda]